MPNERLDERLEQLFPTLSDPAFLDNRGIGNEIGFYIFAYDAGLEPRVAGYLPTLRDRLRQADVPVIEIDLYRLILELLDARNLLEQSFKLEAERGSAGLEKALKKIVRPERIVEAIREKLSVPHRLAFLTGVGAAYPLVRSHTVLNNLHAVIDTVPLVMFFPGTYTGQELQLFGRLKDDNYYRAFPLLQKATDTV